MSVRSMPPTASGAGVGGRWAERSAPALAGRPADSKLTILKRRLAAAPARRQQSAGAPQQQADSFISQQDGSSFSASQLEFLERKRLAAAGLGPVMPESCTCPACSGGGRVVCPQCQGSGVNATDKAAELFGNERGVVKQNGAQELQWFFVQDCPCWLCRGGAAISCPDCGGSGLSGLADFVAD